MTEISDNRSQEVDVSDGLVDSTIDVLGGGGVSAEEIKVLEEANVSLGSVDSTTDVLGVVGVVAVVIKILESNSGWSVVVHFSDVGDVSTKVLETNSGKSVVVHFSNVGDVSTEVLEEADVSVGSVDSTTDVLGGVGVVTVVVKVLETNSGESVVVHFSDVGDVSAEVLHLLCLF